MIRLVALKRANMDEHTRNKINITYFSVPLNIHDKTLSPNVVDLF